MSPNRFSIALIALAAVSAAPAPDPTLARIIADAQRVEETSFAFERTTRLEAQGKTSVRVERFRPDASPRWTLVSVDGKPPVGKDASGYAKGAARQPVPNYGRVGAMLEAGAERVAAADGAVVYRVARLPKDSLRGGGAAMAQHLAAEATVGYAGDRPYVTKVRVFAPKAFRMRLVAKVDRFEALTRYTPPDSDGRPRVVAQETETAGSMLGRSGTIVTRATFRPI